MNDLSLLARFFREDDRRLAPVTKGRQHELVVAFAEHQQNVGRNLLRAEPVDVAGWVADGEPQHGVRRARLTALGGFYEWAMACGAADVDPTRALRREPVTRAIDGDGERAKLLQGFRISQERRGLARNTIYKRACHLLGLADFLEPRSLLAAETADIEAYVDSRRLAAKSRNYYLSHFKVFYSWCRREGLVDDDPTEGIDRARIPVGLPRPISDDDLIQALRAAPPLEGAFLALAAFAGLRCQEIAGVWAEDVMDRREPAVLRVRAPKGNRERMVPLHPEVQRALVRHGLAKVGPVFAFDDGRQMNPWTVSQRGAAYLRSIGVEATMHQLRHWFGSTLYGGSKDIVMTGSMMGHSTLASTMVYVAFNPGDAVDAVTSLAPKTAHENTRR